MSTLTRRPLRISPQTVGLWVLFLLALWMALRLLLVPDPQGGLLFARAQRLEQAGLVDQALRQYDLLASTRPDSAYAPRALQRRADILTEQARGGQTDRFKQALAVYRTLATNYPQSVQAGQALLAEGAIYMVYTKELPRARSVYLQVLHDYPHNARYGAEATLCLGRVAYAARDGHNAQLWLQSVLRDYVAFPDRCAEAQFHLGETYELLFQNRDAARNAYEATVRNYPNSVWSGNAKERLGLLLYAQGAPRARRVLITIAPRVIDHNTDSIDAAVQTLLEARGIDISDSVYRGWTLTPFFAGVVPTDLGRVSPPPFAPWQNAAAAAGLRFSRFEGGTAASALGDLQNEIDAAHLALIYNGAWRLVGGYDSEQKLVMLRHGAVSETVTTAALAKTWNHRSPLGGNYSLVTFSAPGQDDKAAPTATTPDQEIGAVGQPASTTPVRRQNGLTAPGAKITPVVSRLQTPTFVYDLKPLSETQAHRRTLRRAAAWLRRSNSGGMLVNGAALQYLHGEMARLAAPAGAADNEPVDEGVFGPDDLPPVRSENPQVAAGNSASPGTANGNEPAPSAESGATGSSAGSAHRAPLSAASRLVKARALLAWRGKPLLRWLASRRSAVAYLDIAAPRLKDSSLRAAAAALREEINTLAAAGAALPQPDALTSGGGSNELSPAARRGFGEAARLIENARSAEARAADLMAAAGE